MSDASKAALVTGATSGIGSAIARTLARSGFNIVAAGRSADAAADLVDELGSDRALAVTGDVTVWPDVQRLVAESVERFGQLDVVVANAGVTKGPRSFLGDEDPADWETMIQTNMLGTAFTIRAALPELIKTRGRLVVLGSVLGRYTMTGSLYAATKSAVCGMAEAARKELVGTGVAVVLIEPGPVDTGFSVVSIPLDRGQRRVPMLHAEDVARTVQFAIQQPAGVDINEILLRPHGAQP